MNFCPNCGAKLIEGAKFCSNCGFNLQSIEVETPVTVADTPEPDTENTVQAEPDQLTPRNAGKQRPREAANSTTDETTEPEKVDFTTKYAKQLAYPKDKKVCAVDGEPIGFMSGRMQTNDNYFVCEKHFRQVYLGWYTAKDSKPSLIEFLEQLDDPNHIKAELPSAQAREAENKRLADSIVSNFKSGLLSEQLNRPHSLRNRRHTLVAFVALGASQPISR